MRNELLGGKGIRLYNLFPRILGNISRWKEQLPRIRSMGFNAIYVNPFHYPGFSGSLYSPKDYFKFNPLFIADHPSPNDQLKGFIDACHQEKILFLMDLVINHTAIDSSLIHEHPSWYKRNPDGSVFHPGAYDQGKWVEWGDLAEIDNSNSKDRENLWAFWWTMMSHFLNLGADGFRCDAAYSIPDSLWKYLFERARQKKPGCLFLAESLGCTFQMVEHLAKIGFDYLFNSIKYWDFNQPWGIEQYKKISPIVSTISFPESHDTARLMAETNGNLMMMKQRYAFSAFFSKGVMIPTGFEFGFRRRLNVVDTQPDWWESPCENFSDFIRETNQIKDRYEVFNHEVGLEVVDQENWYNVFCFKRSLKGCNPVVVAVNKDACNHQRLFFPDLERILGKGRWLDISPEFASGKVQRAFEYFLRPSEIKILSVE